MSSDLRTSNLRLLIERFQAGEAAALNELLRRAGRRLEHLARSMLRRFPRVRQREQTPDVVQEAMLSLSSSLEKLSFDSTREFYGLAAEHVRRRLLDLARRHKNPLRDHRPLAEVAGESGLVPAPDVDGDLDRWQAVHEAAESLPADQREVFSLRFYHGWSNQEVADLLHVSTKTVTRLWDRAVVALKGRLGGHPLPWEEEPPP